MALANLSPPSAGPGPGTAAVPARFYDPLENKVDHFAVPAIKDLNKHNDLPLTHTSDELIHKAHNGWNETTALQIKQVLEHNRELASKNLPSARSTVAKFVCELPVAHYYKEIGQALDLLIYLLETDPIERDTSNGIVELAMQLMKYLDRDLIQRQNIYFQQQLAHAYHCVIVNILSHYGKKHLNAFTIDLKGQLLKTEKALEALNKQKDYRLRHIVAITIEGIKRIKGDESALSEAFEFISNIAEMLSAAYKGDLGGFVKQFAALHKSLANKWEHHWYESHYYTRSLIPLALVDYAICCKLLTFISGTYAVNRDLALSYLDLLFYIANHSKDPKVKELVLLGQPELKLYGLKFFLSCKTFEKNSWRHKRDSAKKSDHNIRHRAAELILETWNRSKGTDIELWRLIKNSLSEVLVVDKVSDQMVIKLLSTVIQMSDSDLESYFKRKDEIVVSPVEIVVSHVALPLEKDPIKVENCSPGPGPVVSITPTDKLEYKEPAAASPSLNNEEIEDLYKKAKSGDPEALKILKLKAEAGIVMAQFKIGLMHGAGLGLVAKDKQEAFRWFKLAAEQGLPIAQNELGIIYERGDVVPTDRREAFKWYKLAAEQGFSSAQTSLGILYEKGVGVPQNKNEAQRWWKIAAEQGNERAQFNLGCMFEKENDQRESFKWYKLAAEKGFTNAQDKLGEMYHLGVGVDQDYYEAFRWYKLAAEKGFTNAQDKLGELYHRGIGVDQDCSEAFKWYKLAADKGLAGAQFMIGNMYEEGEGVTQDWQEAFRWYKLAADQGDADAQFSLGEMYSNGEGVVQDMREAFRLYKLAADQRYAEAQCTLAKMYESGEVVAQDKREAFRLYKLAAEQGDQSAQFNLGKMYYSGEGVAKNLQEAFRLFKLAAEQGNEIAQCKLGRMYANGIGVAKDDHEAFRWYKLSAEQGSAASQNNLGNIFANGKAVTKDDHEAFRWYKLAAEQGDFAAQYNVGLAYRRGKGVAKNEQEAARWFNLAADQGCEKAQIALKMLV